MNQNEMKYPVALKWLREFQSYEAKVYQGESNFSDCEKALISGDIAFVQKRVTSISWAGMGGFGDYMEVIDPIGQDAFRQFVAAAKAAR